MQTNLFRATIIVPERATGARIKNGNLAGYVHVPGGEAIGTHDLEELQATFNGAFDIIETSGARKGIAVQFGPQIDPLDLRRWFLAHHFDVEMVPATPRVINRFERRELRRLAA